MLKNFFHNTCISARVLPPSFLAAIQDLCSTVKWKRTIANSPLTLKCINVGCFHKLLKLLDDRARS